MEKADELLFLVLSESFTIRLCLQWLIPNIPGHLTIHGSTVHVL